MYPLTNHRLSLGLATLGRVRVLLSKLPLQLWPELSRQQRQHAVSVFQQSRRLPLLGDAPGAHDEDPEMTSSSRCATAITAACPRWDWISRRITPSVWASLQHYKKQMGVCFVCVVVAAGRVGGGCRRLLRTGDWFSLHVSGEAQRCMVLSWVEVWWWLLWCGLPAIVRRESGCQTNTDKEDKHRTRKNNRSTRADDTVNHVKTRTPY